MPGFPGEDAGTRDNLLRPLAAGTRESPALRANELVTGSADLGHAAVLLCFCQRRRNLFENG